MEILIITTLLFIFYLVIESLFYGKRLNKIGLRITVSGTRGKTTIVRLLASVLRANGMTVLAKTTGSEASYIMPDGKEEAIKRSGLTSIIEQKKLINKAIKLEANCVLTEIMSIDPENHLTETHKLIKPGLTILSNFRPDHTDVSGSSIEEIANTFINDIYPSSKILIHENELNEFIVKGINRKKSHLIKASANETKNINFKESGTNNIIQENLDLVIKASSILGISNKIIIRGINSSKMDIGGFEIYKFSTDKKEMFFVNSFAANDPVSTINIIKKTILRLGLLSIEIKGILSLRNDRGERSRQWLEYLKDKPGYFKYLYLAGNHSGVLDRKIPNTEIIKNMDPENITKRIISESDSNSIIFGLANIKGLGASMAKYWNEFGTKI